MSLFVRGVGCAVLAISAAAPLAAHAQSAPVGPSDFGTVTLPFTQAYGDTFTSPQTLASGSTLYSFTDAYTFTIPTSASYDSFTATISLGPTNGPILNIANLQAGVFTGDAMPAACGGTATVGTFIGCIGSTSGAVSGLAWNSGSGGLITLSDSSLAAGTYTIEVRGFVNGTSGGSYSGVVNLAAIPEPSSALLSLGGVLLLAGGLGLKKRR